MFYLLLPNEEERDRLQNELREQEIGAVFHYLPLHLSPMGERYDGHQAKCPVTEEISGRLLRLPMYYDLTEEDQNRVIDALFRFK